VRSRGYVSNNTILPYHSQRQGRFHCTNPSACAKGCRLWRGFLAAGSRLCAVEPLRPTALPFHTFASQKCLAQRNTRAWNERSEYKAVGRSGPTRHESLCMCKGVPPLAWVPCRRQQVVCERHEFPLCGPLSLFKPS